MNLVARISEELQPTSPLRDAFMRWQCRVRQIAMRENLGRPDDASTPMVQLACTHEPLGKIITVICKSPEYSTTPELQHIYRHTNEPAQRREKALQLLSETYYQKHAEFSDMLTATFTAKSEIAIALEKAAVCQLTFDAYGQQFELVCVVTRLGTYFVTFPGEGVVPFSSKLVALRPMEPKIVPKRAPKGPKGL